MISKKYLLSVCVLFALIAIVNLLRVISGWSVTIENFEMPKMISVLAFLIAGFFSYKSFVYWQRN